MVDVVNKYKCFHCKTIHDDIQEAVKCEQGHVHAHDLKVFNVDYKVLPSNRGYPRAITVKSEGSECRAIYVLRFIEGWAVGTEQMYALDRERMWHAPYPYNLHHLNLDTVNAMLTENNDDDG